MSSQQAVAHYHITAKLGEGGTTDTKLNRDVAIKIMYYRWYWPPGSEDFRSGRLPCR
jgi:hypothetical protein